MYKPFLLIEYIEGIVQDWSNSSKLAMELLQSCTKPSVLSQPLEIIAKIEKNFK